MIRKSAFILWAVFAGWLALTASISLFCQFWLPHTVIYKDLLEQWVADTSGYWIEIGSVRGQWRGLQPGVVIEGVQIMRPDTNRVAFEIEQVSVGVALIQSMFSGRLSLGYVEADVSSLSIERYSDGHIGLPGFSSAQGSPTSSLSIPNVRNIRLRVGTLQWNDRPLDKTLTLDGVDVFFDRTPFDDRLEISLTQAGELAESMRLLMVTDSLEISAGVTGPVYFQAIGLQLAQLAPFLGSDFMRDFPVTAGRVDLELWGDLERARLTGLSGQTLIDELNLRHSNVRLPEVSANLNWRYTHRGWRLDLDELAFRHDQDVLEIAQLSITRKKPAAGGQAYFLLGTDALDLGEINRFLYAHELVTKTDSALQLSGTVEDFRLRRTGSGEQALYTVSGVANQIGVSQISQQLTVSGVNGLLSGSRSSGLVWLSSNEMIFRYEPWFDEPLPSAALAGMVSWHSDAGNTSVRSDALIARTATLKTQSRFEIDLSPDSSPNVDLQIDILDGDIAALGRYLPFRVMRPTLATWLARSLPSGHFDRGGVVLRGKLDDFPFDHNEGRFQALLDISDTELDYGQGWEPLKSLEAGILFDGRRMELPARQGRIYDTSAIGTTAVIEDLLSDDAVLSLDVVAVGDFGDGLRYLKNTPLKDTVGPHINAAAGSGGSDLRLVVDYPLFGKAVSVDGSLRLSNAKLGFSEQGIEFDEIEGEITIRDTGVWADDLQATLVGRAVTVSIETPDPDEQKPGAESWITLDGTFGPADYNQLFPSSWYQHLAGEAKWRARMVLPKLVSRDHPVTLDLTSDLRGLAVDLPDPLWKYQSDPESFSLHTVLAPVGMRMIEIDYRDQLRGVFDLDGLRVAAVIPAEVVLGAGELSWPVSGRARLSGELDHLDISNWQALLDSEADEEVTVPLFNQIDLAVAELSVAGLTASQVQLSLLYHREDWHGEIDSDQVKGRIVLDYSAGQLDQLRMDLDHLNFVAAEEGESIAPSDLPAMNIQIKRLVYDGVDFGRVGLHTSPLVDGLSVDEFSMHSDSLKAMATGRWSGRSEAMRSQFEIELEIPQIDSALSMFGFDGGIRDADARAELKVQWPDSPMNMDLKALSGSMEIDVGKGSLPEVKPGVGRVLGLLSLQTIQRRLSLDFSDLLGKGFSFDRIEATFEFDQGDAYTDSMTVTGPAALIEVSGRTGMIARDYDQLITVTPKVTSSLPVAGALVGGPVVGAALFLVQKLLGSEIEKLSSYQYRLTGGWDDPIITPKDPKNPVAPATDLR